MKINSREEAMNLIGKTIRFTKDADKFEIDQDEGMMAIISHITYNMYEDIVPENMCHQFFINQTPFEEENKKFETHNYYDTSGVPCLTAREAGLYKAEDQIYLGNDLPFEVVNTNEITISITLEEAKRIVNKFQYAPNRNDLEPIYNLLKKQVYPL